MRITITSKLVNASVLEASAFTATASFFDDSADTWVATAPTSARYRIDQIQGGDPTCYRAVLGWTSLTPATSNAIAITGAQNLINNDCNYAEQRQITVQANTNLATQYEQTWRYCITNVAGQ